MITPAPQNHSHIIEKGVLKNASEIIYHTGLLKNEVVELSIADVMQNGSIVSTIPPLSDPYPRGYVREPVILSDMARKLIDEHIKFLQDSGLSIFFKSPLFPFATKNKRYDESELWSHLSSYCIYVRYERHRESGIHSFCWELSKNKVAKQQIIDAAHQFSRYSNIERTAKLVDEGISRDPKIYENVYRSCHGAAGKIIGFHEMFPNKVDGYLSEFQRNYDLLLDRDKNTMLNKINKGLGKTNKKLVRHGRSLIIEEISEIKIDLKMIKRKKRRKFN
ncbi:hypothetical protein ACFL36_01275 [Thermodesulfobacteriota bacterium]